MMTVTNLRLDIAAWASILQSDMTNCSKPADMILDPRIGHPPRSLCGLTKFLTNPLLQNLSQMRLRRFLQPSARPN
jgi:hypothetical protein